MADQSSTQVCVIAIGGNLGSIMDTWQVTYHYPKRIGNVTWFRVVAKSRLEAINEVAYDPDTPRILRERGTPVKITAKKED